MVSSIIPENNVPMFIACVYGAVLSIVCYNFVISIPRFIRYYRQKMVWALMLHAFSAVACLITSTWFSVFPNGTCNYHYVGCATINVAFIAAHLVLVFRLLLIYDQSYHFAIQLAALILLGSNLAGGLTVCAYLDFTLVPGDVCVPGLNHTWITINYSLSVVNNVVWSALFVWQLYRHYRNINKAFSKSPRNSSLIHHDKHEWGKRLMLQSACFAIIACIADFIDAILNIGGYLESTLNVAMMVIDLGVINTIVTSLISHGKSEQKKSTGEEYSTTARKHSSLEPGIFVSPTNAIDAQGGGRGGRRHRPKKGSFAISTNTTKQIESPSPLSPSSEPPYSNARGSIDDSIIINASSNQIELEHRVKTEGNGTIPSVKITLSSDSRVADTVNRHHQASPFLHPPLSHPRAQSHQGQSDDDDDAVQIQVQARLSPTHSATEEEHDAQAFCLSNGNENERNNSRQWLDVALGDAESDSRSYTPSASSPLASSTTEIVPSSV